MNIIFGSSGHAKEIDWILSKLLGSDSNMRLFVTESLSNNNANIISEDALVNLINQANDDKNWIAYVAIGNGTIRKKIVNKFMCYQSIYFANLISDSTIINSNTIKIGNGNIVFPQVIFTTNISIGNHNHFNLKVSISHECEIGDFNTFSPSVTISGNVKIGNNNFFGVGSNVIDGIIIADNVVVGAGAVVIHDLLIPGTYVGIPAKKIK